MTDKTCSVENCERQPRAKGLCEMHYQRFVRHGTTERRIPRRTHWCGVTNCDQVSIGRGLCSSHWQPTGLPAGDTRHGTENGYGNYKCRCDDCRRAHTASTTLAREARWEKGLPADSPLHGRKSTYFNYGCQCGPCRDGARGWPNLLKAIKALRALAGMDPDNAVRHGETADMLQSRLDSYRAPLPEGHLTKGLATMR